MMNLNNNPTIDQLAQLFAVRKDSLDDHLLWISQTGEVRLDRLPPNSLEDEFAAHLPSTCASSDDRVRDLLLRLERSRFIRVSPMFAAGVIC